MDRGRVVSFAGGLAVGVAAMFALYQVRSREVTAGSATSTPDNATASGSASRTAEIAMLRARIVALEQAERSAAGAAAPTSEGPGAFAEPDEKAGMTTDDGWWSRMPHNPSWDDTRKRTVIDRLAKYLDVRVDPKRVECRTRCCRITVDEDVYDAHREELMSSVGLRFEPPDGYGTAVRGDDVVITTCWQTTPPKLPMPDRGAERDAMLAKAADAIRKCSASLTHPLTLRLELTIDEEGQIARVTSNKAQLGNPAANCGGYPG